jgi:hypothetical protein
VLCDSQYFYAGEAIKAKVLEKIADKICGGSMIKFYKLEKGIREFSFIKGPCGCIIIELWYFGVEILLSKDCRRPL